MAEELAKLWVEYAQSLGGGHPQAPESYSFHRFMDWVCRVKYPELKWNKWASQNGIPPKS